MTKRKLLNGFRLFAALLGFALFNCNASADAGSALRFNGTNTYVTVPHSPALNAFPLTITAWVKTLRNSPQVDGIVSKYADASGNGYSLNLRNGNLYAWYFRAPGSAISFSPSGLDGGGIADGHWHQIAFVITSTNGTIYVDGNVRNFISWTGTAGAPTSVEPLQIGHYDNYTTAFQGEIDEVALWNRVLPASEVNYLKHRRLGGKEDGLLGYWRFDEGSGTVANNTATNAFHGSLVNSPPWVSSHAAVALEPVAANCLKFDGVNGYVQTPHAPDLNSYPLTVSAWFRTTNSAAVVQGIASKYADGSGNGWTMVVQSGKLRAFYFRSFVNSAMDVTSSASITDGVWHHAAMVVDASGGKLFLDGALIGSSAWSGTPGSPTSTEPLQIGRYSNYPNRIIGAIDEVAIWNRALTSTEIGSLRNLLLAGNEANLIAYWRLDEGTGSTTADLTGLGHTGTLVSNPAWIGSTAYLGDGSVHLIAAPSVPNFTRQYAIATAPGKNSFTIQARGFLRRFYDFGSAPPSVALVTKLDGTLQSASSATVVPVKPNTSSSSFSMTAYNASSPQPLLFGSVASLSATLNLEPDGAQLDSINELYEGIETLTHTENGGVDLPDGSDTTGATRLLHFNGTFFFGPVATIITNIANTPAAGALFAPNYVQSLMQVSVNGGYIAAYPALKFGGGVAFTVNLGTDGTATNLNGSFSLTAPGQFFESAGIRYQIPGATLGAAGMTATSLLAWFPTGFGVTLNTNNRSMLPFATRSNIVLDANLLPNTNNLVFTAASLNTNRLYFSEETKPFLIGATQIEWHIPEGEFYISSADSVQFVREGEDADLSGQAPNLVNPLAADRISNDGYYRHITTAAGSPIYVRQNVKGAALLSMRATLQENELRPHFPYMSRAVGGHIPVAGGTLIITNDLIDPASHLLLAGPVPVPYARDCGSDTCNGAPTIGVQVLNFTAPAGEFGLGQLNFTSDGGLIADGSIPAANLTWGFIGGSEYAQRTSDVSAGTYYFSGTFLHPDDFNNEQDARRPGRILLTGRGSSNDVSYTERPGDANYGNGFANYAGLNFRAPAQGRSVIAGTSTGFYPLTPRSKYYVRFGGVNGIHESATFPANLTLYGYAFTFQSYRLSFLDSDNYESRTDGVIALPIPSGFPVEFERMKFLCRGNLDSARLPANIDTKHLNYWNTDFSLLSLQFKPLATDTCSLTKRYLVLGVETKLPFIPQAFHAALAIKSNGNLATAATGVQGVDSRFAIPANLQLQGPGGSFYPITTAAEGYFNNWETPGRPASGFYSIVGRIRVPFFRDIKTQFHVTPTGPTTAQVNLMGGWVAEEGLGSNHGWNNGSENYFNKAKFDPNHDGWPTVVTLNNYRNSPDEQYRQRAQQNWIDVAKFDYPLTWNAVLRSFSGFVDAKVILPVIDVDSRLKEISPGKVDFDFAQDISLQLPRIKVLDFANDALNELNAPINSVSNAIREAVSGAINTTGLTSGFRSLQNLMRENAEGLFRPILDTALTDPANNVVDKIYAALAAELPAGKANLLSKTAGIVASGGNGLQTAMMNLNGTAGDASRLFGKLNGTLNDVDDTLGLFIRVLEKDGSGKRNVVRTIVQKLAQDQGPALGFAASLGGDVVDNYLGELEPTLAKIEAELRQLRSEFTQLRSQITVGDFASS
ncbi:MAG: LamG domain-containing protein, partial [Verrucomicrobiota bacterium]